MASVLSVIERFLRSIGCETRQAGGKIQSSCPFASTLHAGGRDERPSFVVFPHSMGGEWPPVYACSACHESGSVENLIQDFWVAGAVDGATVLRDLYDAAGGADVTPGETPMQNVARRVKAATYRVAPRKVRQSGRWHDKHSIKQCSEVPELPAGYYDDFRGSVPRYALERGFTIETCKAWDLGHDRDDKRLMFPLYDETGRLVAVSGRSYSCRCGSTEKKIVYRCRSCKAELMDGVERCDCGGAPQKFMTICANCSGRWPIKYRHSRGFKRNLFLYGEHLRKVDIGSTAYVVEGNLDAPMLWQAGYRPVVATLGSNVVKKHATTSVQIEKMVAWWDRVIVVADGDAAGRSMAEQIKRAAGHRIVVTIRNLPDGEDPANMVKNRLEELRKILGPPSSL